jgi:calcineurin-like phosphoesterase family protein
MNTTTPRHLAGDGTTTWFTSDLHFGHLNILNYCQNRRFEGVAQMDEHLIESWNSVVGVNDDVYVLGDVCMGKIEESLSKIQRLNGANIRLVVGNHDRPFGLFGEKLQKWENKYLQSGFCEIIHGSVLIDIGWKEPVLACHFPYHGDSGETDRHLEYRPVDDGGRILLHGHNHGKLRKDGNMIDVGVDAWGGSPVSVREILELIDSGENQESSREWLGATCL